MIVSANERRNVLKLFNVSEVARQLGVGVFQLHNDIRRGHAQSPKVRVGRRLYFTSDDVSDLSTQYQEGRNDGYKDETSKS